MKTLVSLFTFSFFLYLISGLQAQEITCTSKNQQLTESLLEEISGEAWENANIGQTTTKIGKRFLNTPYVGGTLEINGMNEQLVVNLSELDCTTFLENAVVFSRLIEKQIFTFDGFTEELQLLRYRNGELEDYPSRLHYFSEWITNNEEKGILTNITKTIGGEAYKKNINFMSKHRDSYPSLANDNFYRATEKREVAINEEALHYIPQENIAKVEEKIEEGDLIAITTKIKGLDISHVGLATWQNNRLHLLHASSVLKKVVISEKPLAEYIQGNKNQSGIMIARLNPVE